MKFCSGFCFQLSTTSKQSLTADTQLARILDQNLDFTLKAVTSKIDKPTSFPSPAASHPVLERCLSEKHIWRDHSSPTVTVTLLQCWKVKDSFVPVLQWCWSGSRICVYEGTCTFRHLHRAQEPTAQGNSYWVNHNSGLRQLPTQTCFWCSDQLLQSSPKFLMPGVRIWVSCLQGTA